MLPVSKSQALPSKEISAFKGVFVGGKSKNHRYDSEATTVKQSAMLKGHQVNKSSDFSGFPEINQTGEKLPPIIAGIGIKGYPSSQEDDV